MQTATWIDSERDKYNRIWKDKPGSYGASSPELIFLNHRMPKECLMDKRPWLIVGSGDGQGYRWLRSRGIDANACDISTEVAKHYPAKFKSCPAHAIPHPGRVFGTVLCIDVIEHIPEEFVIPSLREMARVCNGSLLVQARCAKSVFEDNLHLTVKPHEWWRTVFRDIGPLLWEYRDNLDMTVEISCE
jgi:2-polyprenyl-3-methyl-5-hydroxy-6-metoxy-1,4-benzoquinol methylase